METIKVKDKNEFANGLIKEEYPQFVQCSELISFKNENMTLLLNKIRPNQLMALNDNYEPTKNDSTFLKSLLSKKEVNDFIEMHPKIKETYIFIGDVYENCVGAASEFIRSLGFKKVISLSYYRYVIEKSEFIKKYGIGKEENYLDSLKKEDVPHIQNFHSVNMPNVFVEKCIEYLPSSCIRDKKTNIPVAWRLRYFTSRTFGFCYVRKEMRRKGLGRRVCIDSMRKSCKFDEDLYFKAHLVKDNIAATKMQESVGTKREKFPRFWVAGISDECYVSYV